MFGKKTSSFDERKGRRLAHVQEIVEKKRILSFGGKPKSEISHAKGPLREITAAATKTLSSGMKKTSGDTRMK
jgi:hypothetical protein